MSNKFLGLDSINVIKEYIDERIVAHTNNLSVVTFQAYRYYEDDETPVSPTAGGYDGVSNVWRYPEGWSSLKDIMLTDPDLSTGSIYMSVGVQEGGNPIGENWSIPVKISGQNGVSVRFQYSYDPAAGESSRTPNPLGPTSTNPVEYVWTKTGDGEWVGPKLWAKYSETPKSVLWRYCVTADNTDRTPIVPSRPGVGNDLWSSDISNIDLSQEHPNLWMSWKIVIPDESFTTQFENPAGEGWSEPILYGHYGLDGSVPDYKQTLYRKGDDSVDAPDTPGIVKPAKPVFIDGGTIEDYMNDGWVDIPTDEEAAVPTIWWQCTFKVDGRTDKVNDETCIGDVYRYTSVDGTARPGPYTKAIFRWSEDQNQPEVGETLVNGWCPEGWNETPDRPTDITTPEPSLWMISCSVSGLNEDGYPIVTNYSDPVKLTGPRGPIGYDYRNETRYMRGTEVKPEYEPDEAEWTKTVPETSSTYPYIWAKNYLVCYMMEYGEFDESINDYRVVPTGESDVIEEYDRYRLSGTNGEDGNRKNSVHYSTDTETVDITSFASKNYYICNSTADVTYNMNFDILSFINGYTGKFANIGTANMILNGGQNYLFSGSGVTTDTLTIAPQETIELVTYNVDGQKHLLVIGKDIKTE